MIVSIIFGIFLLLHGLVHLLYTGQSARLFELQSGMVWPDGSWALAGILGNETARAIASGGCALVALGFIIGGIALFTTQFWWRPVIVAATTLSAAIFILFWDGQFQAMSSKGLFAILINAAILITLLAFRWPRLEI